MNYNKNTSRYRSRSQRLTSVLNRFVAGVHGFLRKKRRTTSPRTILLIALAIALGGALCCQVIWQHMQVDRLQYEI
ncbi:MAG: hypothetical protein ABEJ65_09040, partial [bacterium]